MPQVVEFEFLSTADLIVDAIYEGKSQHASDPISKLLPGCGNMGGFRLAGKGQDKQFVSLFTTGQERDWPDRIDLNTGQFTYYGDNRTPGHELHETPLGGNRVLRRVFELLHSSPPQRELRHSLYSRNTRHRKYACCSVQRAQRPWPSESLRNRGFGRCMENLRRPAFSELSVGFHHPRHSGDREEAPAGLFSREFQRRSRDLEPVGSNRKISASHV